MKKKKIRNIVIWSVIGFIVLWFIYAQFIRKPEVFITVQKEVVIKETLYTEVFATGTINPIEMVQVGTQVSGKIAEVKVDFNDKVKEGQVLARMDMRNLRASLDESRANLNKAKIALEQAERNLKRTKELFDKGLAASIELETAQNDYDNALATYEIAKLQLDKNKVNLGYADVISPIDGVVISRNVEVGQTVAATFTTPTLFSIARDLTDMKIEASIDEADIGQVKVGQNVIFTVDAYPEDEFYGKVEQVRLQPTIVQNVVTYNVLILISNPDLKLMPGMTATIIVRTGERPDAMTVPNSAIEFKFSAEDKDELLRKNYKIESYDDQKVKTIWIQNGMKLKEIPVEAGMTNGIKTVIKGNINPGDSVITNLYIRVGEEDEPAGLFAPRDEEDEE